MKKICFFTLMLAPFSLFTACKKHENRFSNKTYRYTITYPLKWELQNNNDDVIIIRSPKLNIEDPFRENCTIVVEDSGDNKGPYLTAIFKSLKGKLKNLKIRSQNNIVINGLHMETGDITYSFGTFNISARTYIFTHDNKIYKFFFTSQEQSFGRYNEQFESIIRSISFNK